MTEEAKHKYDDQEMFDRVAKSINSHYHGFLPRFRRMVEMEDEELQNLLSSSGNYQFVYKEGLKSVVRWINDHKYNDDFGNVLIALDEKWRSKLKEWGITK